MGFGIVCAAVLTGVGVVAVVYDMIWPKKCAHEWERRRDMDPDIDDPFLETDAFELQFAWQCPRCGIVVLTGGRH